ncbi:MAG: hypothetical protein M1355_02430 [Patescibacteria group bacterium]|nr:hypothetical protein [Patescibacteria group bacterium]
MIQKLQIGDTTINIEYKEGDDSVKELFKYIKMAFKKAEEFFGYKLNSELNFLIIYSREEMDKHWGSKTKDWITAFTNKQGDRITMFSPSKVEEYTKHPKERIYKIIQHEIFHLFINSKGFLPWWLNEGLASYLADQKRYDCIGPLKNLYKSNKMFTYKRENFIYCMSNGGYRASYFIINKILDDFGKGKIIKLLKLKPTNENINSLFEKVFEISPQNYISRLISNA